MEMNHKYTEVNENVLNTVAGGITGPASKYDPGDKVRYLNFNNKEAVGIVYEAIYFAEDSCWKYLIKDMNGNMVGSFVEGRILGIA